MTVSAYVPGKAGAQTAHRAASTTEYGPNPKTRAGTGNTAEADGADNGWWSGAAGTEGTVVDLGSIPGDTTDSRGRHPPAPGDLIVPGAPSPDIGLDEEQ
jgi:hypothetical protein